MKRLLHYLLAAAAFLPSGYAAAETAIHFDPIPSRPIQTVGQTGSNRAVKGQKGPLKLPELRADNSTAISAYANMWYKGAWDYGTPAYGIYAFPTGATTQTEFPAVKLDQRICGNAGAVYANGKYFVATAEEVNAPNGGYVVMSMRFYLFDTKDWSVTQIADADEEFKAMDMAYDPTTDRVYGCFVKRGTDGYYYFGSFDITTGKVTMIRNYGQSSACAFTGVAISPVGDIYAINASGDLYRIDKATGETTLIGQTGLPDQYMTSAAWEPTTGRIYYALNTDNLQGLYEINPTNAVARRVYSFPDEESLAGMYFPEAATAQGAPGEPTALTATFAEGNLSGTVTFTAPSTTYGGETLSGNVSYNVTLNGVEKATGDVSPGRSVSCPITVDAAGDYSVAVTCSNSAGKGETAHTRLYIGEDTPLPVENVILTHEAADGSHTMTLTWDAAQPVHGGWLDNSALRYTVTRYPDNVTVTTSSITLVEQLPEPATRTRYQYSVAATLKGSTTEARTSNSVTIGTYNPPMTLTFENEGDTDDLTLIDNNNDNKSWVWQSGQMHSTISLYTRADDWLIFPPVKVKRSMSYRITTEVKCSQTPIRVIPERMAIWAGSAPTVQAMTTRLLPATDISNTEYQTMTCDYTPEADGEVYFAIQACSDADAYYLWVNNFSIGAPMRSEVPAAVSGLTATPGADGALTATLAFTLPDKDMSGGALTAISRVEIYRDDTLLTTLNGTPGQKLTYTDNAAPNGEHTYGVTVVSAKGSSVRENTTIYIGVHQPQAPEAVTAVSGADNGEKIVAWEAPLTDTAGVTLPANSLRYRVIRYDRTETVVADGLTATTFTDRITQADAAQEFVAYGVVATNVAGDSEESFSATTTYGRLIAAPVAESFAGGASALEFVMERDDDNASWTVTNPSSNPGVDEQDGDGGLLRFTGITTGDHASFISPSFSVTGLANPALSFYFLYPVGTDRGITATVYLEKDGELRTVTAEAVRAEGNTGWQRLIIPIDGMPDRVQFVLTGCNYGEYATNLFIDNIRLSDLPTPNMTMNRLTAPAVVEAKEQFELTAYIENSGVGAAPATVTLRLNGNEAASRTVQLAAGEHAAVTFAQTLGVVNPDELVYTAEVTTPGDAVASDNLSDAVKVGVHQNNLPAPTGALARSEGAAAVVRWQAPDLGPETPQEVTDDVEGYVPFSIGLRGTEIADDYLGQWTSYDADGLYTIGVGHGDTAIPNATVPKAFMAFNGEAGNMTGDAWTARSGKTMFVAFSAIADYGTGNDDWLISPLLTGSEQTVTLWARSCTDLYGLESLEILYSKKGTAPADFQALVTDSQVPAQWKQYTAALPAGTRYFAVRCTSADLFALCVDDITYTPAGFRGMGLELQGYNIWRDNEPIASVGAEVTEYADAAFTPGTSPAYRVTAIYNSGESRPSNSAVLDQTAITGTEADGATVSGRSGSLMIEGAAGMTVTVAFPDGRLIYSGVAQSETLVIPAAAGTYIVRAGNASYKVAVR